MTARAWWLRRRYERDVDEALEDAYQSYLKRKGKREELETAKHDAAVAKRARLGKGGDLDGDASGEEQKPDAPATFSTAPEPVEEDKEVLHDTNLVPVEQPPSLAPVSSGHWHNADIERSRGLARRCLPAFSPSFTDIWWALSSRESQTMTVTQRGSAERADVWACSAQMDAGGGLLVRLDKSRAGVPRTAAAVAARWFAQDIFSGPGLAEDAEDEAAHASASAQPAIGELVILERDSAQIGRSPCCNAAREDSVHACGMQMETSCYAA